MKTQRFPSIEAFVLPFLVCLPFLHQAARADFVLGEPEKVPNINSSYNDGAPTISSDGLELYFVSRRPPGGSPCGYNLWVSRRSTTNEPWGTPVMVDPPIPMGSCDRPCVSASGLEVYFADGYQGLTGCPPRPGGHGASDLWVSTRTTQDDPWSEPQNLGATINTAYLEAGVSLSHDGLALYFESTRPGGFGNSDLWVAERTAIGEPWGEPQNLGSAINGPMYEYNPFISADGLSLYWAFGGYSTNIRMSRRATTEDPWEPATPFEIVNSDRSEYFPSFSEGCSVFYFARGDNMFTFPNPPELATYDTWQLEVTPIVDFDGDGKVDGKEVSVMADHWDTENSLCDVGPRPFGDGVVNLKDLIVLADYIGEEIVDPTLIAHWALDETEGAVAADSAGESDAMVAGDPLWQPDAGVVDGALALDGVNDCIVTNPVEDLAAGPFSILAWVRGGAPDQVLVAHGGGGNWLYTNPADGSLATDLCKTGGSGMPLLSDVVITDSRWHRIGLVWDGTNCILLVDEREVAQIEKAELQVQSDALMIGGPMAATPGRFFSGVIDDVRIYRRAVTP